MLINGLRERIDSLRTALSLAYLADMSRLLCSVRLVFHPVRRMNQRLPLRLSFESSCSVENCNCMRYSGCNFPRLGMMRETNRFRKQAVHV